MHILTRGCPLTCAGLVEQGCPAARDRKHQGQLAALVLPRLVASRPTTHEVPQRFVAIAQLLRRNRCGGATLTYSLSGADADVFTIVESSRQLTTKGQPFPNYVIVGGGRQGDNRAPST